MISKKYLGLFVILCTLGITTPGMFDVDASSLDKVSLHSVIPGKSCVVSQFPLLGWVCHFHIPPPPPIDLDMIVCGMAHEDDCG